MSKTINNLPRELLERVTKYCVSAPDAISARNEVRALLSAPSPAGVDGLEVVGYLTPHALEVDMQQPDDEPLCRLSDAQAIIDGLRGEVERKTRSLDSYGEELDKMQESIDAGYRARMKYKRERDQQAQRIGELEGLLRDARELITHGVFEDGVCCCGSSVESHGFGDGHSPVDALSYFAGQTCERIDAALSAGKEKQDEHN